MESQVMYYQITDLIFGHTRLNILDQSLLNPVRTKQALEKHHSNVGVPNGTKLRMLLLKEEVAQKMSMMTQYRKDRAYNSKAPSLRTICDQKRQDHKYRNPLVHFRSCNLYCRIMSNSQQYLNTGSGERGPSGISWCLVNSDIS